MYQTRSNRKVSQYLIFNITRGPRKKSKLHLFSFIVSYFYLSYPCDPGKFRNSNVEHRPQLKTETQWIS